MDCLKFSHFTIWKELLGFDVRLRSTRCVAGVLRSLCKAFTSTQRFTAFVLSNVSTMLNFMCISLSTQMGQFFQVLVFRSLTESKPSTFTVRRMVSKIVGKVNVSSQSSWSFGFAPHSANRGWQRLIWRKYCPKFEVDFCLRTISLIAKPNWKQFVIFQIFSKYDRYYIKITKDNVKRASLMCSLERVCLLVTDPSSNAKPSSFQASCSNICIRKCGTDSKWSKWVNAYDSALSVKCMLSSKKGENIVPIKTDRAWLIKVHFIATCCRTRRSFQSMPLNHDSQFCWLMGERMQKLLWDLDMTYSLVWNKESLGKPDEIDLNYTHCL